MLTTHAIQPDDLYLPDDSGVSLTQWPAKIVSGEFKARHSITQQTGIEERYAGRILNCAFLAPDIIEAILEGRQQDDLTVQKMLRALPVEWASQRKRLGFPMICSLSQ